MLARLEAALQRERNFVADAGHELRTPLALLRTELELALRHGESAEELRDALRRSSEEVDRLTQLADALLLIARSDQGHLELRLEELDAADVLDLDRDALRVARKGGRRGLSPHGAAGLRVRGDRMRLEQALGNLMENALRHGPGEVKLWRPSGAGAVELHVRDEGAGFPPDFIADAFTRFARPTTAGRAPARVSACRSCARSPRPTMAVRSAENLAGGGVDVWLALPRDGPQQRAADTNAERGD